MSTDALWYIGAALLALIGVPLFVWAVFYDRNRHQRRCPKCYYQLVGEALATCPECGREIKNERELHRTRRRWRWAALGILLAILSFGFVQMPAIQRDGWWSVAPTQFVVAMLDDVNDPLPLLGELDSRLNRDDLTEEQCRIIATFIIDACVEADEDRTRRAALKRFVNPYSELQAHYDEILVQRFKTSQGSDRNIYISLLKDRPSPGVNYEILTTAFALFDDPHVDRYGLVDLIAQFSGGNTGPRDALIQRFGSNTEALDTHIFRALNRMQASNFIWDTTTGGSPRERRIALSTVDDNDLRMYEDKATIISILWDAARSYDPQLREAAFQSLCRFTGRGEEFDKAVARGLNDSDPKVRLVVAKALRRSAFPEIAERGDAELAFLSRSCPDSYIRSLAINYRLDEVPSLALDEFINGEFDLDDPIVRSAIVISLGARYRSEKDDRLLAKIIEFADDEDASVRRIVVRAISIATHLPPEAMKVYEKLMRDPDEEVRKAAEESRAFLQPHSP